MSFICWPTLGVRTLCSLIVLSAGCSTVLGLDKDYTDLASGTSNPGGASGEGGANSEGGSAPADGGSATGGAPMQGGATSEAGSPPIAGGSAGAGSSAEGGAMTAGSSAQGGSGAEGGAGNCQGASYGDVCWYLAAVGVSCNSQCSTHGDNAASAASFVGIPAQGGSLAKCAGILGAIGGNPVPGEATRSDGRGVGCHVYNGKGYWLSSPTYSPSATASNTRVVCGCQR